MDPRHFVHLPRREPSNKTLDLAALNLPCLEGWIPDTLSTCRAENPRTKPWIWLLSTCPAERGGSQTLCQPAAQRTLEQNLGSGCSQPALPRGVDPRHFVNLPRREPSNKTLDLAALNLLCLKGWIPDTLSTCHAENLRTKLGIWLLSTCPAQRGGSQTLCQPAAQRTLAQNLGSG